MKLTIGYFYPNLLNLYGDRGNIEILTYRAQKRGITVEVLELTLETQLSIHTMNSLNLVFMGGGPDSSQKEMYMDLTTNKAKYLQEFIENGGVGLFICGAYQLLGHYYKAATGDELPGLGVFDLYTHHFGNHKPRCIGNVVCELVPELRHDSVFNHVNQLGSTLVGFENHGGRTYLGKNLLPLATVSVGYGNNGEDKSEGALYKNAIGTYLHGPVLAKNPHLADYLLAKSLQLEELAPINDNLIVTAHTAAKKLSQ